MKNILQIIVIVAAVAFFYSIYRQIEEDRERAELAALRDPQKSDKRDHSGPPPSDIVSLMLEKSLRDYLNDPGSYRPIDTRIGNHPEGFAYVHEYRARNAFGGMIKDMCGLLCSTNGNTYSWTFYSRDNLPSLLSDVTVDGKPLPLDSTRNEP